jgi:hypothetical protein
MGPASARRIYHSGRGLHSASSIPTKQQAIELRFVVQCWWEAGLTKIFAPHDR